MGAAASPGFVWEGSSFFFYGPVESLKMASWGSVVGLEKPDRGRSRGHQSYLR